MQNIVFHIIHVAIIVIFWNSIVDLEAATVDERWSAFCENRVKYIKELTSSVKECVIRNDTSHPVFHGCVDWHSSVHGYWALLRSYRAIHEEEILKIVLNSLDKESMHEEYIYLINHPKFEMPYGRSWFLKLMKELEIVTGSKELRYISDYVAKSLTEYIASKKFDPSIGEYRNLSWAYRNLLEYYIHTNDEKKVLYVKKSIRPIDTSNVDLELDRSHPEFFSVWGNLAHLLSLSQNSDNFTLWLKSNKPTDFSLRPVKTKFYSSHHLGINYSRAWALWSVYSITNETKYLESYIDHVMIGFSLHETYSNSYRKYGHWVPQFGIYAITSSMFD